MIKPIIRVEGSDGVIELLPDRVVVTHEGFWNVLKFGFNAKREIPLSAISEIGFKNANILMFGEIDFIVVGRGAQKPGGLSKKAKPSAVQYKKNQQKEFEVLKEKVFQQMAQQNRKQT